MDDLLSLPVRAILDAGGETWATVADLVARRIDELGAGQILHIMSREPSMNTALADWCRQAGHEVLAMAVDGDATRIWIRKGG